jgi:hypothetical protein
MGSLNEKIPVGNNWRRYVLSLRQNGDQNNALANASSLPKTVELNGTFRKISGRQDPAINIDSYTIIFAVS